MFLGQWGLCEGAEVPFLAYIGLKCLYRPDIKPYRLKNLKSVNSGIIRYRATSKCLKSIQSKALEIFRGFRVGSLAWFGHKVVFRSF